MADIDLTLEDAFPDGTPPFGPIRFNTAGEDEDVLWIMPEYKDESGQKNTNYWTALTRADARKLYGALGEWLCTHSDGCPIHEGEVTEVSNA